MIHMDKAVQLIRKEMRYETHTEAHQIVGREDHNILVSPTNEPASRTAGLETREDTMSATPSENLRDTELYKIMNPYLACEYAEQFGNGEDATERQRLIAWQYIRDTGLWRSLQGFYGRTVAYLLEIGSIQ